MRRLSPLVARLLELACAAAFRGSPAPLLCVRTETGDPSNVHAVGGGRTPLSQEPHVSASRAIPARGPVLHAGDRESRRGGALSGGRVTAESPCPTTELSRVLGAGSAWPSSTAAARAWPSRSIGDRSLLEPPLVLGTPVHESRLRLPSQRRRADSTAFLLEGGVGTG